MSIDKFVDEARRSRSEFLAPVRSLMDVDFYKFTMGQVIWHNFLGTRVTFKLIVRDKDIPLNLFITEQELRNSLDYVMGLALTQTDLYYLRGMDLYGRNMFSEGYLDFLKEFKLPPYTLKWREDGLELTFSGEWAEVSMWETIALAIISCLYYRKVLSSMKAYELELVYARAMDRISRKLEEIASHPRIRFADFSQRRRHSFLWQEWVIGLAVDMLGPQFTGTSNTWMAFHHSLTPVGTNAHELPMVLTALAPDTDKVDAQYEVLKVWQETYGQGLRIFLPDTYGTKQFLANAPGWLAGWKGFRQDSGEPMEQIEQYLQWLELHGANPADKLVIPSDGLDVEAMKVIDSEFGDRVNLAFGWGTLFGNDFRGCHSNPFLRPFSMVCKVVEADGSPCVKLSDNIEKATGPRGEVEKYIKIFGNEGRVRRQVVV
jgi:nicotinate phosphoribosyltransferase